MVIPELFKSLVGCGCADETDVAFTTDGFCALHKSISDILGAKGITHFMSNNNDLVECNKFFDDWYIYAVKTEADHIYSLFKLREQEYDSSLGGDGDTPGVTISFVQFNHKALTDCINSRSVETTAALNKEINRVVAKRGQKHNKILKNYFVDTASEGAYLVAELFVKHIVSFAGNGAVDVSEDYKKIYENRGKGKNSRIPDFIDYVNKQCGYTVCDHKKIYVKNARELSDFEKRVILAVNTGNVSFSSFGAEVEFHARFLISVARVKIPFLGASVYESAIRADMTICDKELEGPVPYYNLNSRLVKRHIECHGNN